MSLNILDILIIISFSVVMSDISKASYSEFFQLSVVYFRLFANVQNKDSSDERVSEKNCVIAYC